MFVELFLAMQSMVVFVVDDVSDEDLDAVPTPNIDALAEQGRRFRRAYSMPTCSPTRSSALFGRIELEATQAACYQTTVFPRVPSLPDAFDDSCAFGKWHVGTVAGGPWELTPQMHGFGDWRCGLGANVTSCGGNGYWDWTRVESGVSYNETTYQTEALVASFRGWWSEDKIASRVATSRFAWVSFSAPHPPFHVPPIDMLDPSYPRPSRFASDRDKWEAMLASVDYAVGQMLQDVDFENTTIVVVGDNGTPNKVSRIPAHAKFTTYELGVKVPLIVREPGMAYKGIETFALAHVSDLLATFANGEDGFTLRGPLSNPADPGRRSSVYTARKSATVPTWGEGLFDQSVIGPRWKLRSVDGTESLYDLWTDPDESNPLPAEGPEAEELRKSLR